MQSPSSRPLSAFAPGKIILSGEHAVVYGRPALVSAVGRGVRAAAAHREREPLASIAFPGLPEARDAWPPDDLRRLAESVRGRYGEFLEGRRPIAEVLDRPIDFLAYALWRCAEAFDTPLAGLSLGLHTDLPIGCGLGSSAAAALAVLRIGAALTDCEPGPDALADLALDCERLQHGRPSGVDPWICSHGGTAWFRQGRAESLHIDPPPLQLVHSGTPHCTTGESVARVAAEHGGDSDLWDDFAAVAGRIRKALEQGDRQTLVEGVRENHHLLCRIGVVPEPVRELVHEIETLGGAAKICGAGAVRGPGGGIVLALADEPVDTLARAYKMSVIQERLNAHGVRLD